LFCLWYLKDYHYGSYSTLCNSYWPFPFRPFLSYNSISYSVNMHFSWANNRNHYWRPSCSWVCGSYFVHTISYWHFTISRLKERGMGWGLAWKLSWYCSRQKINKKRRKIAWLIRNE
jgi:hypothetical protein